VSEALHTRNRHQIHTAIRESTQTQIAKLALYASSHRLNLCRSDTYDTYYPICLALLCTSVCMIIIIMSSASMYRDVQADIKGGGDYGRLSLSHNWPGNGTQCNTFVGQ
jgi:hypothetical protein